MISLPCPTHETIRGEWSDQLNALSIASRIPTKIPEIHLKYMILAKVIKHISLWF